MLYKENYHKAQYIEHPFVPNTVLHAYNFELINYPTITYDKNILVRWGNLTICVWTALNIRLTSKSQAVLLQ